MKCPYCNQISGGKTFGDEKDEFCRLLKKVWSEGMYASLMDMSITRENCRDRCPYDIDKDIMLWHTWVGGLYHAMCWRYERPDEVARWLLKNDPEEI